MQTLNNTRNEESSSDISHHTDEEKRIILSQIRYGNTKRRIDQFETL